MSMLMQLGTRAMFAAYTQLETTAQNISNANTPGYSRQQVVLGTTEGQFTGSGFVGRGVSVQTITRAYNTYLATQAAATRSVADGDKARLSMLKQLEGVFGSGSAGIGGAATQIFNAFTDLAAAPNDLSARQAVVARAEDFASLARSYSDQIEVLQGATYNDVGNSIDAVNTAARGVAELNVKISAALTTGHTPNDLMDMRDRLISEIASKIEVQTVDAPDGSVGVYVGRGQSLVLRGLTNTLVTRRDDFDPSRVQVGLMVAGELRALQPASLGAGSIAGLLKFQDQDLVDARCRLGQIVACLGKAMNDQQAYGYDQTGNPGSALFQLRSPPALPATTNAVDALGLPIAAVTLTVQDPSALQASEYTLEEDPANAGLFRITRLSDGTVFDAVPDGGTVDGFSFTFGATAVQPGDRFLLKPVSTAQAYVKLAMVDPRGIAAANPLMATAAATNTGTATVGALTMESLPATPYSAIGDMQVVFTSATGDYEIRDASNAVLASGTWSAGQPIQFNGFALALQGVPANGDSFALKVVTPPGTNNGNALTFDALAGKALVNGRTVSDAYADTLSAVGVRVRGAEASADTSAAVASRAADALTSEVGVNLDEEAARLIQFQQAYQAAAKMLQTAQKVMDMLVEMGVAG